MEGKENNTGIFHSMRNMLLYGGLEKERYLRVKAGVREKNQQIFRIISGIDAGVMLLMTVAAVFSPTLHGNLWLYLVFAVLGGVSWILLSLLHHTPAVTLLCYCDIAIGFAYGYLLTFVTRSDIDSPAVTFVALMIVLPLMMTDVFWRMLLMELGAGILFLVLSWLINSTDVFTLNLANVGTMMLMGIVLFTIGSVQNYRRFAAEDEIAREHEIEAVRQQGVIDSLADIIESRDEDTGDHVARTSAYIGQLMEWMTQHADRESAELSPYLEKLTPQYRETVASAASLHDVGKIRISDTILNKPGRLTPEEFEVIKKHTIYGGEIVNKIIGKLDAPYYQKIAYNIARSHHERWDGKGYPDGLKGEEIPLEARLMSLVDVYDALRSKRVYKPPYSREEALRIIKEGRGTQFDPYLTDAFLQMQMEDDSAGAGLAGHA